MALLNKCFMFKKSIFCLKSRIMRTIMDAITTDSTPTSREVGQGQPLITPEEIHLMIIGITG